MLYGEFIKNANLIFQSVVFEFKEKGKSDITNFGT